MAEAELKHARLAMLAVAGWPMAELWNGGLAQGATNGRAPAVFNGGLFDTGPIFFVLAVFAGAAGEGRSEPHARGEHAPAAWAVSAPASLK